MPYRIDLFAVFIFLGIVQGLFLVIFFLSPDNRKVLANLFHGLMLISIVACLAEIFLMYTGYIIHVLFLVDFSEVFGLCIGPFFYLLVVACIHGTINRKHYLHLAFPLVYLLLQIPFLILPDDAKYNAWIGSYHPDLPFRQTADPMEGRIFWLTDHCTDITLFSLFLYITLGIIEIIRAFRKKNASFFTTTNPALKFLRWEIFQIGSAFLGIFVVKLFHKQDTGDHLFAAYITVTIYLTSFRIIRDSGFFKRSSFTEPAKYKGSTVTSEAQHALLEKLQLLMQEKKPFLQPDFSLPELAKQLSTTVHTLSQVINDGLGKSFFEMTAEYRVGEAQLLLRSSPHIKIEEIAGQVGYSSKSSFNTSFKKYTGKTPSEFRNTFAR